MFAANAIPSAANIQMAVDHSKVRRVAFITPEELKTKIARSERVTIIDVRASGLFAESDEKIRGASALSIGSSGAGLPFRH